MTNKSRDRKRQKSKVVSTTNNTKSKGAATFEDGGIKGQEELQLEALLFGKPTKRLVQPAILDVPQPSIELGHLMDSDVCVLFFRL
jgi:hypothetical protein